MALSICSYLTPLRYNSHFKLTNLYSHHTPYRLQWTPSRHRQGNSWVGDSLNWRRIHSGGIVNSGGYSYIVGDDDDADDEEDEDEEEEDRSLDLLIMFVQNVFKKISKKARKAVRAVLPVPISSSLVGFSVNGVLIIAFMWILKAFLEVVCTLGTVVFTSILIIRGIWTGISYLQASSHNRLEDDFNNEHERGTWTGTKPAY